MIDRFGREIDDDYRPSFTDGSPVRMAGESRIPAGSRKADGKGEGYHSNYFRNPPASKPDAPPKKITRGAMTGMTLSVAALAYAVVYGDVPVFFLAISFLSFVLAPTMRGAVPHGEAVEKAMRAFSIGAFIGAFVIAFF